MKKKKNIIIAVMICVAVLMATGYAYFATRLNINATGNITSNWNVYFSNITSGTAVGNASNAKTPSVMGTSATMDVNLSLPGDSMTYELTLMNGGSIGAIIEDIEINATGSSAITYEVSGLEIGDKLASGASKVLTIKIEYDVNTTGQPSELSKTLTITIDAVQDIGQNITGGSDSETTLLAKKILNENNPQSDSDLDFSKASSTLDSYSEVHSDTLTETRMGSTYFLGTDYTFDSTKGTYKLSGTTQKIAWKDIGEDYKSYMYTCKKTSATSTCTTLYKLDGVVSTNTASAYEYTVVENYIEDNGKGLYYTAENTEDNKTTYYFRGNVENNYVSFGMDTSDNPIIWRIVRINEDGSIRLITESTLGSATFNADSDNAHAGYMYGQTGATGDNAYRVTHSNDTDSEVKTIIDSWYVANLNNYSNLIADAGFCNDRSIATAANTWGSDDLALGYGQNRTYYGAYNRVVNLKQPQFACLNPENDLFTLKSSTKGNKTLDNPIGLLTADEAIYAGYSGTNKNIYLHNNVPSWTMSPEAYGDYATLHIFHYIFGSGNLSVNYSNNGTTLIHARPVINLISDVEFTLEGTGEAGTATNPYVIKTN